MNEMIIKFDNTVDLPLIKKMFENIKGVVEIKIKKIKDSNDRELKKQRLHSLIDSIDTSYIDLNDDRTQYILSK